MKFKKLVKIFMSYVGQQPTQPILDEKLAYFKY